MRTKMARRELKPTGVAKSSRDSTKPKRVVPPPDETYVRRVSFLVSSTVLSDIRVLAGPDETMTDVFKKAVASLKYLEEKRKAGKRFFIGESPDAIESEVVLLR